MSSKFSIFQLSYLNYAKLLQKVKINKNFKEWTEKIAKILKNEIRKLTKSLGIKQGKFPKIFKRGFIW